jgi:hypothetical protein
MIVRVLAMAPSWSQWDGIPIVTDGRTMTPLKALRRVGDHVIDHLAEVAARRGGVASLPDAWHHSAHTTAADLAPMTAEDLNEATERLRRLAQLWTLTFASITDAELDTSHPSNMTLRELADHTAESIAYADALGVMAAG